LTSRHGGSLVYQRAHVADVGFNPDVASGVQKGNFDRNGIGSAKRNNDGGYGRQGETHNGQR